MGRTSSKAQASDCTAGVLRVVTICQSSNVMTEGMQQQSCLVLESRTEVGKGVSDCSMNKAAFP